MSFLKNNDLKKMKQGYETKIKNEKKKSQKQSIKNKTGTFLNTYDYEEFLNYYPGLNQIKNEIELKILPFSTNNKSEFYMDFNIAFRKHISKNLQDRQNCLKNIEKKCPFCENKNSLLVENVIFPVYVVNTTNNYLKNQIKLLELEKSLFEDFIYPNIEMLYHHHTFDLITEKQYKNKNYYQTNIVIQSHKLDFLTEDIVLTKTFDYHQIYDLLFDHHFYYKSQEKLKEENICETIDENLINYKNQNILLKEIKNNSQKDEDEGFIIPLFDD